MLNRTTKTIGDQSGDRKERGKNSDKIIRNISQERKHFNWVLKDDQMCIQLEWRKVLARMEGRRQKESLVLRKDRRVRVFMLFGANREQLEVAGVGEESAKIWGGYIVGLQNSFSCSAL